MNREIERKFLVTNNDFINEASDIEFLIQGYLVRSDGKFVRIRTRQAVMHKVTMMQKGLPLDIAYLTIKIKNDGDKSIGVDEFEYEIPFEDGIQLLSKCFTPLIKKTRHTIKRDGKIWEVDIFNGHKEGLILAEIELKDENEPFEKPSWLGEEVTGNKDYYNANM